MKKTILSLSVVLLLFSCNKKESTATDANADKKFDAYKEYFVEGLWKLYPDWAANQGYHKYDSILVVPNADNQNRVLEVSKAQLDSLAKYDLESLSDNNKTDYHTMKNLLESTLFSINEIYSIVDGSL